MGSSASPSPPSSPAVRATLGSFGALGGLSIRVEAQQPSAASSSSSSSSSLVCEGGQGFTNIRFQGGSPFFFIALPESAGALQGLIHMRPRTSTSPLRLLLGAMPGRLFYQMNLHWAVVGRVAISARPTTPSYHPNVRVITGDPEAPLQTPLLHRGLDIYLAHPENQDSGPLPHVTVTLLPLSVSPVGDLSGAAPLPSEVPEISLRAYAPGWGQSGCNIFTFNQRVSVSAARLSMGIARLRVRVQTTLPVNVIITGNAE